MLFAIGLLFFHYEKVGRYILVFTSIFCIVRPSDRFEKTRQIDDDDPSRIQIDFLHQRRSRRNQSPAAVPVLDDLGGEN